MQETLGDERKLTFEPNGNDVWIAEIRVHIELEDGKKKERRYATI